MLAQPYLPDVALKSGSYNSQSGLWTDGGTSYTINFDGTNAKVTGTLPYEEADATLGLPAGNRYTYKIQNSNITSRDQLPSGVIAKITNTQAGSGYNEYDKSAFEEDGSLIVVVNIGNKNIPIVSKMTWTEGNESVYTADLKTVILAAEE